MAKKTEKSYQEMNLSELSEALVNTTTALKQSKISLAAGNLTNTNKISALKKEIARINTAINHLEEEEK